MDLNYCSEDGVVGPSDRPIPTDPGDYWLEPALCGVCCNNLVCDHCHAKVRHADNLWPAAKKKKLDEAKLYETPDWSQSEALVPARGPRKGTRLYGCRCSVMIVALAQTMASFDEMDKIAPPWRCAGHPIAELPITLSEVPITAETDLRDLVLRGILGEVPPHPTAFEQRVPVSFVFHLYVRLLGTPYAERVSRATAELLLHPDAQIRIRALYLFKRFQRIPGWETFATIAREHPELYGPEQAPGLWRGVTMQSELHATLERLGLRPPEMGPTDPHAAQE